MLLSTSKWKGNVSLSKSACHKAHCNQFFILTPITSYEAVVSSDSPSSEFVCEVKLETTACYGSSYKTQENIRKKESQENKRAQRPLNNSYTPARANKQMTNIIFTVVSSHFSISLIPRFSGFTNCSLYTGGDGYAVLRNSVCQTQIHE